MTNDGVRCHRKKNESEETAVRGESKDLERHRKDEVGDQDSSYGDCGPEEKVLDLKAAQAGSSPQSSKEAIYAKNQDCHCVDRERSKQRAIDDLDSEYASRAYRSCEQR